MIDFDVTTPEEELGAREGRVRSRWPVWLLLMAFVVLVAAMWMVARIPLEPVPIPSPQLPPGAEDVGHPLGDD